MEEGNSSGEDRGDVEYEKKKDERVDWGQGSHQERMDKSVSDWLDSKGDRIDSDDKVINLERIIVGANVSVVLGLYVYRLHPPGLTRSELLAHMISYRETHQKSQRCTRSTLTTTSAYLDLEISKDNDTVLRNIERLIVGDIIDTKRNILAYAYGTNNNMILARRNLDSWGNIKSHCGFVNYAENLKRY